MKLLLHIEEVDEDLVNVFMRVVTDLLEQPAEGVLDRARRDRMAVRLDRGQVEDVLPGVYLRDEDALGEDLVELEERAPELADLPFDLGERRELQAVSLEDREPAIVPGAFLRVGDHGFILDGEEPLAGVAVLEQGLDDAVDLPGLARTGREVLGPGQVELEERRVVLGKEACVVGQAHELPVIVEDGRRGGPQDGDAGPAHSAHLRPRIRSAATIQRKMSMRRGLSLRMMCSGEPPSSF